MNSRRLAAIIAVLTLVVGVGYILVNISLRTVLVVAALIILSLIVFAYAAKQDNDD